MGDSWGSPLKPKKEKEVKATPSNSVPKGRHSSVGTYKELTKFPKTKLLLPKSEAKKLLDYPKCSLSQTEWTQRWLQQKIQERSLPPQIVGADSYGKLSLFLSASDCLSFLTELRQDFLKTLPKEEQTKLDFSYLENSGVQAGILRLLPDHLPLPASLLFCSHQTSDETPSPPLEEEED